MKTKLLVKMLGTVLAFTCVLGILCGCTHSNEMTTDVLENLNNDTYILDRYVDIEYDESYYGEVIYDMCDDEHIGYYIYDGTGNIKYIGKVVRSYAINRVKYAK